MAVVCHNCGGENEESQEWCSRCGAPLARAQQPPAPAQAPSPQPPAPPAVAPPPAALPSTAAKAVAGQVLAPQVKRPPTEPGGQAPAASATQRPQQVAPPAPRAAAPLGGPTPQPLPPPAAVTASPVPAQGAPAVQAVTPPAEAAGSEFIPGAEPVGGQPAFSGGDGAAPRAYDTAAAGAMAPMPYMPYGYPYPYGGLPWWMYTMPPFFPCPMPYPGAFPGYMPYSPYQYPQGPAAYPYGAPRGRMRPLYIALIVIGVLLIIGGAVTAAVLLTGETQSSFKLGDASVSGTDIDFSNLVLSQDGSTLTLTGTYDNNTKKEGDAYLAVDAIGAGGNEQTITFVVPVQTGKDQGFTQTKTTSVKLSGATLGTVTFSSSSSSTPSDSDSDSDSSPYSSSPSNGTDSSPYDTYPYDSSPAYDESDSSPQ